MSKSSKRIKLENEIFSKSIKDIELMFNFSYEEDHDGKHKAAKSRLHDGIPNNPRFEQKTPKVQLNLGVRHIEVDYDCINMSFFSDSLSESDEETPFYLAPNNFLTAPLENFAKVSAKNTAEYSLRDLGLSAQHNVLLDLNDDDEIDGYSFGLDLKQYLPRMNLESDLKRIDQMFAAPALLTKIS